MKLRRSFFNLYHAISLVEYLKNMNHSGDVSYRDITFMNVIMFMDNCTVSKLSKVMGISKPAVTVRINHMIEEGLVIKSKSIEDERVNILMVSPDMYTKFSSEDKQINRALTKMCENYSPEEISMFADMMDDLSVYLSEMDENMKEKKKKAE